MNAIFRFLAGILYNQNCEPLGLCGFDHMQNTDSFMPKIKERKRELRLSELIE